jgi:hypothetical protein
MYLKSLPAHCPSCPSYPCVDDMQEAEEKGVPGMPENQTYTEKSLPGKNIVANILNYARALEVFRKSDGESLLLILN